MNKHSTSVDIEVFLVVVLFLALVAVGVTFGVNYSFGLMF